MLGAEAVFQLFFGVETFAAVAVMATELAEIDVAGVIHFLQKVLHRALVRLVGGAHETVVGNAQLWPERLKASTDGVHEFLGGLALLFGGLHYLVAVLVRAGQKQCVLPLEFVKAGQRIRHHRGVGVPQMRIGIDVVNGRGDEKAFHTRLRAVGLNKV